MRPINVASSTVRISKGMFINLNNIISEINHKLIKAYNLYQDLIPSSL